MWRVGEENSVSEMANPLHQFEIHPVVPCNLGKWDISLTNSSLTMMIITGLICLLLHISTRQKRLVPTKAQAACEMFFEFVEKQVSEQIGKEGRLVFPYVFCLFTFILTANVCGMIPYTFTVTSHLSVTFTLAMLVFLSTIGLGLAKHKWRFFRQFFPENVPVVMAPLLVPVEIISFCARPVSLAVRLFANMVAGHIMLKIVAGAAAFLMTTPFAAISVVPVLVSSVLMVFELFIAALQAYVFTILSCIYLNGAIHLE